MFDFTDRVVIVTGAAGILGQAVASAFRAAGAKLILVDHAADRLASLYADLGTQPDFFLASGVDLTDAAGVAEMASSAIERFGKIDVLVNVAGGFKSGAVKADDFFQTWDFMFDLNTRTAVNSCRAVIPYMLKQRSGKIVNIAARAGLSGSSNQSAYSASKSALIRFTESLSAELRKEGINVNCILPSTIDTPDNRKNMPNADFSRWLPPDALADIILFLASDAARVIHGVSIPL